MVDDKSVSVWMETYYMSMKSHPHTFDRIRHSFGYSQLQSKRWLDEELTKLGLKFNSAAIVGGWYCHFLAEVLSDKVAFICNYEVDPSCVKLSKRFNSHRTNFMASEKDLFVEKMTRKHLERGEVDLVINTSCEHMAPMTMMKHRFNDPLYVLQSTDEEKYRDHINTVSGPEELAKQAGIVDIKYSGTKVLDNGMKRFMVIGK